MIPKKPAPDAARDAIRGGYRFPAFAKPASADEARSQKTMLKQKARRKSGPRSWEQLMLEQTARR